MMENAQQVRTKLLTVIMAGVASVGFAAAATAAGVGVGASANIGADAKVAAPDNAQAGGSADAHMSAAGAANSNAQWQSGATQGADRAAERASMSATELKQSTDADLKATGKAAVKGKHSSMR